MARVCQLWLLLCAVMAATAAKRLLPRPRVKDTAGDIRKEIDDLTQNLGLISRQLMMQQYYVEEQTRSAGDSGLKRMRTGGQGTRSYHSASHSDRWMLAAIHNHPEYDRLLGFGEMVAVLNGIEFRTRHNDYHLRQRHPTKRGAFEDVPFPEVPPQVTRLANEDDQVTEMRNWFKAWRDQDHSVRDYRPYFRPVLCYLEGTWTNSAQTTLSEPFQSERHHIDAKSWLDLADKIRFTSYSGSKDGLENLAYLPTTVMKMLNGTQPVLAQWNYAILCHPLSDDLQLNRLNVVDDLKTRMALGGVNMEQYEASRTARFQVATFDTETWRDGSSKWSLLDRLMEQIPGRDGYGSNINDTLFDDIVFPYQSLADDKPLNVAYYHRWYKVKKTGALGRHTRHRGFSDENLFVAQTSDPEVAGLSLDKCEGADCKTWSQKWTYAIPLEIVYMTPLSKWNPYNIPHRGLAWTDSGKQVFVGPDGKRNGEPTHDKAYNGTNNKKFYHTPVKFFLDQEDVDPADTVKNAVHVLDANGDMRAVRSSGFWIHFPEIPGVGRLRQRYPIMPLHGEGSGIWKELDALKDIIFQQNKYQNMMRQPCSNLCTNAADSTTTASPGASTAALPAPTQLNGTATFITQESSPAWGEHEHHFILSEDQVRMLENGGLVHVITEEANGHSHDLTLYKIGAKYMMGHCDCQTSCFDGHGRRVYFVNWEPDKHSWMVTDALRPLIVQLDFRSKGKTIFRSVNFAGYIGILTGIKPGLFTLTMNDRFSLDGGYVGVLEWILGIHDAKWVGFLTREVMENASDYYMAKHLLTKTELLSPVYFILGGNSSKQASVITRSRKKALDVWDIGTRNSTWYILETNYDNWKTPLFIDDRRKPAHKCLDKLTQKNVGFPGLFDVLSSRPVLNKLTTYTALMQVDSGTMETYLRYCPDPCPPW